MGSELWVVLLFALGLSLIVAEIFLVGVVLGLIGLTCMLVSIYFGFEKSAGLGWTLVVIAAASVPVLAFVWVKVINRVLAMKFTQTGYTSAQMQYKDLVGQEGVALTTLRPAGMAPARRDQSRSRRWRKDSKGPKQNRRLELASSSVVPLFCWSGLDNGWMTKKPAFCASHNIP